METNPNPIIEDIAVEVSNPTSSQSDKLPYQDKAHEEVLYMEPTVEEALDTEPTVEEENINGPSMRMLEFHHSTNRKRMKDNKLLLKRQSILLMH